MEVELTDIEKRGLQDHHPQGIVWEYAPDKPFKLHGITAARAQRAKSLACARWRLIF